MGKSMYVWLGEVLFLYCLKIMTIIMFFMHIRSGFEILGS